MAKVLVRSAASYEFACRSAACAPPPAGTGGSSSSGAGGGGRSSGGGSGGSGGGSGGGSTDSYEDQVIEYEQQGRARLRAKAAAEKAARPGHIVDAVDSPHFKRRTAADAGAITEAEARKLIMDSDATGRRVLSKGVQVKDGDAVGIRANLNLKKTTGVTVQTMHTGTQAQLDRGTGLFNGEAVGYGAAVTVRNVNFSVNQAARAAILSKEKNKFPMASVDGNYVDTAKRTGPLGGQNFNGVEVTFNPVKNHTFVDPDGRAVKSVTEATVVGSKVFVRGTIEYFTPDNMPKPDRGLPTESHT